MRIVFGIACLAMMGGCGSFRDAHGPAVSQGSASFADPFCSSIARQRGQDAALNGYADIKDRVAGDAYAGCMANKERATMAALKP